MLYACTCALWTVDLWWPAPQAWWARDLSAPRALGDGSLGAGLETGVRSRRRRATGAGVQPPAARARGRRAAAPDAGLMLTSGEIHTASGEIDDGCGV